MATLSMKQLLATAQDLWGRGATTSCMGCGTGRTARMQYDDRTDTVAALCSSCGYIRTRWTTEELMCYSPSSARTDAEKRAARRGVLEANLAFRDGKPGSRSKTAELLARSTQLTGPEQAQSAEYRGTQVLSVSSKRSPNTFPDGFVESRGGMNISRSNGRYIVYDPEGDVLQVALSYENAVEVAEAALRARAVAKPKAEPKARAEPKPKKPTAMDLDRFANLESDDDD